MLGMSASALSVSALFAEREARRRGDRESKAQRQRRRAEELAVFRKRLEEFQLTHDIVQSGLGRIKRAFERGETELMFCSFPSSFCTDGGRAIGNAGVPPINKPTKEQAAALVEHSPWLDTLPAGVFRVFEYWKANLRPGGFAFFARILNYADGKPGEVGVFSGWPKSNLDA
jgi:hypothetical protein